MEKTGTPTNIHFPNKKEREDGKREGTFSGHLERSGAV